MKETNEPNTGTDSSPVLNAALRRCGNCGAAAAENVSWNRTGGWTCAACGESDYLEAAE